jgi:outer membrane receptor protein involved in Fe transport
LLVQWLGYRSRRVTVSVAAGDTVVVDAALVADPVALGEVVVTASRNSEPLLAAPAAVSVARAAQVRTGWMTGQLPNALADLPGVDLTRSGVNDFNLNARGFNSSQNRRLLVLQDGRDLSTPFLGAQEWSANQSPDDGAGIELVRGPGSALYGANAFSGVLSITTPAAREALGTRVSLNGGGLLTARADIRHAGLLWGGRGGYKVAAGFSRSDTWSRSRTSRDGLDLQREYAGTTGSPVPVSAVEVRALAGQSTEAVSGTAQGRRDPLVVVHGSGRLDHYADDGSVASLEGGATQAENEVFVTGIGRVQVAKAVRPWL